jgi:FXSXX-COOH protein
MREDVTDLGGELIDVSGLSLRDLDDLGETRLGAALRRLLDDPQEPLAGFSAMT